MDGGPQRSFLLHPFDDGKARPALRLAGLARRRNGFLHLSYRLGGAIEAVQLASPAPAPSRRDGLWSTTCFECFFGLPGEPGYWECNLSPAGHWNLYALEDYRRGLRPEPACDGLAPDIAPVGRELALQLRIPLPPAIPAGAPLQLAVAAVIEDTGGALSYWALAHPGAEPDFHHRDGFLLRL